MNRIIKGLPSFFTSLGLICGCISIVISTSRGNLNLAGYFILGAAFFDFIDGFAARIIHNISEFGKQLDSLADVVSFGVAPAMIVYRLMLLSYVGSSPGSDFDVMNPPVQTTVMLYSAFLIAVFSALRLAKFNTDTEQVKSFRGLPTPANAIFFAALGFISESSGGVSLNWMVYNRYFLAAMIVLSCFLLVSNIRMFSLKFASWNWKENSLRYVLLAAAPVIMVTWGLNGLAPVIILYVLLSLLNNRFVRMT